MSSDTVEGPSPSVEGPATDPAEYVASINDVELPRPILELVEEYEAVVGERERFLWKWIYSLFPEFTLSSVSDRHARTVRSQKTIFTIFITLLDDVAEKDGDSRTFDAISRFVLWRDADVPHRGDVDAAVVGLAERLWTTFEGALTEAPRYDEFRDVFEYDVRQAMNAMDYSRIVNDRVSMANLNGAQHYDSHNMVMFPYADVDLMYSPTFDAAELGVLRNLVWDLQKMARIGNWLTTWEREIDEEDYTAGIIVYALQNDLVSLDELEDTDRRSAVTDRIKTYRVEDLFLAEWRQLHRKVTRHDHVAKSVDLETFIRGMETVMEHHLASQGYK